MAPVLHTPPPPYFAPTQVLPAAQSAAAKHSDPGLPVEHVPTKESGGTTQRPSVQSDCTLQADRSAPVEHARLPEESTATQWPPFKQFESDRHREPDVPVAHSPRVCPLSLTQTPGAQSAAEAHGA